LKSDFSDELGLKKELADSEGDQDRPEAGEALQAERPTRYGFQS